MKLKFLVLLFVAGIFAGCSSDDDNVNFEPSTENFVGVYATSELTAEGQDTSTSNGETNTYSYSETGSDFNLIWTFSADGTYTIVGTYTANYSDTFNGETTTESEVESLNESGTYVLDVLNDTLILTGDDESTTVDILSFTESMLSLSITETETSDDFSSMSSFNVVLDKQ